jgi:hypothetical protein
MTEVSISGGRERPAWERLAEHRQAGHNMSLMGVVGVGICLVMALMGELSSELGGLWLVVALGAGGAVFILVGGSLHKRAIEDLRQLPVADRRKAIEYIQGAYQLRQELGIHE